METEVIQGSHGVQTHRDIVEMLGSIMETQKAYRV